MCRNTAPADAHWRPGRTPHRAPGDAPYPSAATVRRARWRARHARERWAMRAMSQARGLLLSVGQGGSRDARSRLGPPPGCHGRRWRSPAVRAAKARFPLHARRALPAWRARRAPVGPVGRCVTTTLRRLSVAPSALELLGRRAQRPGRRVPTSPTPARWQAIPPPNGPNLHSACFAALGAATGKFHDGCCRFPTAVLVAVARHFSGAAQLLPARGDLCPGTGEHVAANPIRHP